jgi:hypothetical protein
VNTTWSTLLGGGFGAAVVWAVVALLKAWLGRKVINADAADKLAGSALEVLEAARKDNQLAIAQARADAAATMQQALQDVAAARRDTDEARRDAAEARRQAGEARREASDARKEAEMSGQMLRKLLTELFRPGVTVDGLRAFVNDYPGPANAVLNGRI